MAVTTVTIKRYPRFSFGHPIRAEIKWGKAGGRSGKTVLAYAGHGDNC